MLPPVEVLLLVSMNPVDIVPDGVLKLTLPPFV
jgi:hypothetical protein